MSLPASVADVMRDHLRFEVECVDRLYLNVYQPRLQYGGGVSNFFRQHRGEACATALVMSRMTRRFVQAVERFAAGRGVPLLSFEKGVRKEDVFHERLQSFVDDEGLLREGVVLIGKAQEKATVFRTTKRRCPHSGRTYPWLIRTTAMVNHYYFYCVDREFGPFFIKFCSYFPYTARLYLNGHSYAKQQLTKRKIPFDAPDNAVLQCDDPAALQRICDGLSAARIDALLRRWLARLPHPFTSGDRRAGYRYQLSMLQAEFSLTQVLDRPQSGRIFFERVIRDNLDLGRADHVQLIFGRRIQKNSPTRFRTRVLLPGDVPGLWIEYKSSTVKQYFKQGRAIRTETTVNNTRDFGVGRKIENLSALRTAAFAANRRLLDVQRLDHDPAIGQEAFDRLLQPTTVDGQRASGLRFGDPTVLALMTALLTVRLLLRGFSHADLRETLAHLLAGSSGRPTPGQMTYQLRRLRLKGLIVRIAGTHRYELTDQGRQAALLYTGAASQVIRPLGAALAKDQSLEAKLLARLAPLLDQIHAAA